MSAPNPGTLRFKEISASPSAPPAGYATIYVKTDNVVYLKDSSGSEIALGTASGITSLTGEATASGPGAASVTLSNSAVIGKVLTGFTPGPNSTVASSDTILEAFEKLQAQITALSSSGITDLTGDVTGSGPGSTATTVAFVGGKTASAIATSVDDTQGATSANTASKIMKRDAGGSVSVTQINGVAPEAHASRHLPSGADPLSTASPSTNLSASTSNAEGSANSFARSDHSHALNTAAASTQTPDQSNATGSSSDLARADHIHNIPTDVPVSIGTSNAQGSATKFAKADHIHNHGSQTDPTLHAIATSLANGFLSSSDKTKLDGATASNTFSTLVLRDGTGNFSAGTITASLTGAASANVLKSGDSMSGNLDMSGNKVTSVGTPTLSGDAANKNYVDTLAVGIIPQNSIIDANLIDDSLSTPPGSPIVNTTYLIGPTPTGDWSAIGAGRLAYWDGTIWKDGLGRSLQVGDRIGVKFHGAGTLGGNLTGKTNQIATVTNATPGFYAYTFESPMFRWTTLVDNLFSPDYGDTYYFNSTDWVEIATGLTLSEGEAISIVGGTVNVKYDSSLDINISNQLFVQNHASKHLPLGSDALTTAAPLTDLSPSSTNDTGTANSLARSDHSHAVKTALVGDITTIQPDASSSAGSSDNFARGDHRHAIVAAAPSTQNPDQTNTEGVSTSFARADHIHNIPAAVPVQIGTANSKGSSASFSLSDHVHDHGAQTADNLHALVVAGTSHGFMSKTDKSKIDAELPTSLGSSNQVLGVNNAGSAGEYKTVSGTSNQVTVTHGVGSITLSTPQDIHTGATPTFAGENLTDRLELTEQTAPSTPASTKTRIFTEASNGFTRIRNLDSTGLKSTLLRDTLILVKNVTGSAISAGKAVYYTGADAGTGLPTVALAKADASSTMPCIGLTVESISNNAVGRVIGLGIVTNIDTSGFSQGDKLYVSASTAGNLTATKPAAPNIWQRIGIVLTSNAVTGTIEVRPFATHGEESGTNTAWTNNVVALTDAATINTDASLGNIFTVTLGGNRTLANPTNGVDGQKVTWRIRQDATGGRTLAFGANFNFPASLAGLSLSTSANAFDYLGAQYNGVTSRWDVLAFTSGL